MPMIIQARGSVFLAQGTSLTQKLLKSRGQRTVVYFRGATLRIKDMKLPFKLRICSLKPIHIFPGRNFLMNRISKKKILSSLRPALREASGTLLM